MTNVTALAARPHGPLEYRQSTDAAHLCRDIVIKKAVVIQGRRYIPVEGWQAIAVAHGCAASARSVERVEGGYRAIGEIRRMQDGALIAEAEGFVGEDEATWFGGEVEFYDRQARSKKVKTMPKRPDYAIRAMTQTRAISRAARSAFAHVVVLIDEGLETIPAEEVPPGGIVDDSVTVDKLDYVIAQPVKGGVEPITDGRSPRAGTPDWPAGPCKNKAEVASFWKGLKDRIIDAVDAGDPDQVDMILRDEREFLSQLRLVRPDWWTGEGLPEGIGEWISKKQNEAFYKQQQREAAGDGLPLAGDNAPNA